MELVTGVESKSDTLQPYGKLGVLPIEVREPIYIELLRTGHLALMRCSKHLQVELSERIYEHGVCRLKFGFDEEPDTFPNHLRMGSEEMAASYPSKNITDKIQHFVFIINGKVESLPQYPITYYTYMDRMRPWCSPFGIRPTRAGKTCHVSMSYELFYEKLIRWPSRSDRVQSLDGFETVTVKGHFRDASGASGVPGTVGYAPTPGCRGCLGRDGKLEYDSKHVVRHALEILEKHLEKGEIERDGDGWWLVFHPREPK